MEQLGIRWLLTYHSSCESAELYELLNQNGILAFYLDGEDEQRQIILKAFEQTPYSVLCSCKILSEGISLPHVDSVYFVDPRSSEIDIIQCVGRCLRKHSMKSLATVLLPENILEYEALLRSMVIYDPRLKDSINKRVIGLGFSQQKLESFENKLYEVNICIYGRYEAVWEVKFNLCKEYESSYGKIKKSNEYKDIKIGLWLNSQKQSAQGKATYKITKDRFNKLMELNTFKEWYINKDNQPEKPKLTWDEKYTLSLEYESLYGIIHKSNEYKGIKIGKWLLKAKGFNKK